VSGASGPERVRTSWADAAGVSTLQAADEVLAHLSPKPGADPVQWRMFHLRAAKVYERVAKVDRAHHYEALACAQVERNRAERVTRQPGQDTNGGGIPQI